MTKKEAIVVAVANNYAVIKIKQDLFKAHIRGNLMNQEQILVGDKVIVLEKNDEQKVIEKILPRKNQLYRPKIANVDQALIVNALERPVFNTLILNKLLTLFNFYQLKTILLFTKLDLVDKNHKVWKKVKYYQELKYECHFISNLNKDNHCDDKLNLLFKDKLSLLTGVTGVGKSSFLNRLDPNLNLATNEISLVLKHGKHTTTTTKLYFLKDGIIADSPGFLVLKLQGLNEHDIATNFPVIKDFVNQCKFRNCLHQSEPDCAVRANLAENEINRFFYQDYCKILLEFLQIKVKEEK